MTAVKAPSLDTLGAKGSHRVNLMRILPASTSDTLHASIISRSLSLDSGVSSLIREAPPHRSKSDTNCAVDPRASTKPSPSCLDTSADALEWSANRNDPSWCERAINAPCFTPTSIWTPTVAESNSSAVNDYQPQYYGEVDAHPHLHQPKSSHAPPTLSEGRGGYMYYSTVGTPSVGVGASSLPSPMNCVTPNSVSKTPLYISDHLPEHVISNRHSNRSGADDAQDIDRFRGQLHQLGVRDPQEQVATARLLINTARGIDELSRRLGKPVVGELVQLLLLERNGSDGASSNIESTPSTADEELLPVGLLELE
ncbi:hypothetical protein FOL47_009489 [Perkinsus chesapeaki]|uniref:Uncharacterized protein n=1 Tax=Perkinsus chesapeaki TaxID=330153 RepID=A0A7J6L7X6_PERCH|nr:hypothetical protein FOL47_009489 [Perkinsus chesapeaki]